MPIIETAPKAKRPSMLMQDNQKKENCKSLFFKENNAQRRDFFSSNKKHDVNC